MRAWQKAFSFGIAFLVLPGTASAQDARGVGVLERLRPSYDPQGVNLGGFRLDAGVKLMQSYTDNVFATEEDTTADLITSVAPDVSLSSTWSRHEVQLKGAVDTNFFASESEENYTDWAVSGSGRLDITSRSALRADAGFRQEHEARDAPDAADGAAEPTSYDVLSGGLEFSQRFNRLSVALGGRYTAFDYDNTERRGGGVIVNDDRDREEYTGRVRLGYRVSPDTDVFTWAQYNEHLYKEVDPDLGEKRDSHGYELRGGVDLKLSRLVDGQVYAGYRDQSYDAAALENVSGFSYGADINWYATPLTTIKLGALSSLEETVQDDASGIERNALSLGVDHELLRNLILSARAEYAEDDFIGSDRKDDTYKFGLGGTYMLNRRWRIGFDYDYSTRESSLSGEDYDENRIGIFLRTDL